MIKKLLLTALGFAALSSQAQLNGAGDGYTLDNKSSASQCNISGADNNGGIMAHGHTFVHGPNYLLASGPMRLTSQATFAGGDPTWFSIPTITGSGATAACATMWAADKGINMSSKSKVSIVAKSSAAGAVLEFFLGGIGQWSPATSTYNTGNGGASIIASHTFAAANKLDTITFDYAALDASKWAAWAEKNKVQAFGFKSGTVNAVFDIELIKFGADTIATTTGGGGGATCSDGIMNQDETGIDCGGANCSPCTTGGGGSCNNTVHTNGYATYYLLLDNGSSTTVKCSFDAVNDVKGTLYGALHKTMLNETPAKWCGACVEMTGSAGTATLQIVDECPTCTHSSEDIDLSPAAFAAVVGAQSIGIENISWKEVSCPWGANPIKIITQGSHQWYAKLIISNHINRVAKVEIEESGSWTELTRGVDNGWTKIIGGIGTAVVGGPIINVRVTDIFGEQIVVQNVDLTKDGGASQFLGTGNFSSCTVTETQKINSLDYISLYPNPSTNLITLEGIEDVELIEIYSTSGEMVGSQLVGNAAAAQVDISKLSSGIYVAKFTGKGGVSTKTFVKQ